MLATNCNVREIPGVMVVSFKPGEFYDFVLYEVTDESAEFIKEILHKSRSAHFIAASKAAETLPGVCMGGKEDFLNHVKRTTRNDRRYLAGGLRRKLNEIYIPQCIFETHYGGVVFWTYGFGEVDSKQHPISSMAIAKALENYPSNWDEALDRFVEEGCACASMALFVDDEQDFCHTFNRWLKTRQWHSNNPYTIKEMNSRGIL